MTTIDELDKIKWSPNDEGAQSRFPEMKGYAAVEDIESYCKAFEAAADAIVKGPMIEKAAGAGVPQIMTFGRMQYSPDPTQPGILPFPGLSPDSLRKIVRENVAPQMIIGMRVDDVLRYSQLSSHPWRPGWAIEMMASKQHPDVEQMKTMRKIETFLQTSATDLKLSEARERDELRLTDFQHFLSKGTRDSMTFDAIAVWTQCDQEGRVLRYGALPSGNIRLLAPRDLGGTANDNLMNQNQPSTGINPLQIKPDAYAVALDDGGNVKIQFTRKELVYYTRNPRTEPEVFQYGYPEIEMAIRVIQGFQNAIDLNADTFDKSTIPNGILMLTGGGWAQKQIDVLQRIWTNLKKGITKAWALPVVATPKEGKMEILDLKDLKGDEVRYQDAMNMFIGALCTLYRFPVKRLGYRISGRGPDTQPNPDSSSKLVDEDDPGLAPLLIHLENLINQYLIWPRWPDMRFVFTGKNPKESAREYEFKRNAMTYNEARAETDLDPLEDKVKGMGEEIEFVAEAMGMCPLDPALSGVYQSLVAAIAAAKFAPEPTEGGGKKPATPGARMQGSKDPAKSESHGKTAGVRRDSASEAKRNK